MGAAEPWACVARGGSSRRYPEAVTSPDQRERKFGFIYGLLAYLLWGFLPLYFLTLAPTGPWEIVAMRIFFSLALCAILLAVTRSWGRLQAIFSSKRTIWLTVFAGVLIYINWQVFVLATLTGHIIETALGYFINPIVTILLGVFVMRERLRPLQWAAVGLVGVAVVVIVVGYGAFPWIALLLAGSFGVYGLIKKKIGPRVDALSGLTLESLWLVPIAIAQLIWVGGTVGITFGNISTSHTLLLMFAGVATAVPLLLFAAATRRTTLTVVGILQFLTPLMQFATGVWIMGEPMPLERWIGFGVVWAALAVFITDSVIAGRRARASVPPVEPTP